MQRALGPMILILTALTLVPPALAQSGVLSGPPQIKVEPVWVAVAGGFDGNGRHVGIGFSGQRNSRQDAENAALTACRKFGRGVRCREAHAVNVGCLYIVPGTRSGGVTWGRGATRDAALSECRRGGYSCSSDRVLGGCVSGPGN